MSKIKSSKKDLKSELDNFTSNCVKGHVNNSKDIIVDNFSISAYSKKLFVDTDLKVVFGRRYGLIGRNGIGKTTIIKHIAARKLPISKEIDMFLVEQETAATDMSVFETVMSAHQERLDLIKKSKELQILLDQDIPSNNGETTTEQILEEYNQVEDKLRQMGADKDEAKVRRILHGLGFSEAGQEQPTRQFSGGWRMRVSLARALYMEPTLLLLDEPTNHLDLAANIWFTDYLSKWKKTLIIISHNQGFLNEVCTDIINIEDKQLVYYRGNYEKFTRAYGQKIASRQSEWDKLERKLREMKKKNKPKKEQQELIKKHEDVKKPEREYVVKINFPRVQSLSYPVLEVHDVLFYYPGHEEKPIFEHVNIGITMEDRITIVGDNGVGKSTLINLLSDNLKPCHGEIRRNRLLRIGYYNQHFVDYMPLEMTPIEFIHDVSLLDDSENDEQSIRKMLGTIGLEGSAHKIPIGSLSGGQKARVAFVALQVEKPHLLFLDEPTNHLDIQTIDGLIKAINDFDGGVVIITHDQELVTRTNCQLWVCENQNIHIYEGDYWDYREEVLSQLEE